MAIRIGSSPTIALKISRLRSGSISRVFQGKIVQPRSAPPPHLPPVHFYAEANVESGGEATVRSEALTNRTGKPVEIHEIRLASLMNFADAAIGTYVNPGGITRVRLTANGKPITSTFIPIWNLGKVENKRSQVVGDVGVTFALGMYVWRLARPWHIPPNMKIECQFAHSGGLNSPVVAKIGLAGKYASTRQTTSAFPFASAYISRPFDYSTTLLTDESSESDLANITGKKVTIDRIIAHASVLKATADSVSQQFFDIDDEATNDIMSIRMATSKNMPIIPEFTPIRQVFGGYPSAIDMPHIIDANDFYRVSVRKAAGGSTVIYTTYQSQVHVSVVGWREEAI